MKKSNPSTMQILQDQMEALNPPKVPNVNGHFQAICSIRGSDNITSYTAVIVEIKDGVVVKVTVPQPDDISIVARKADLNQRHNIQLLQEVVSEK